MWLQVMLIVSVLVVCVSGCGGHVAGGVDIWESVDRGDRMAIERFVASGGDVNTRSFGGVTPLWVSLQESRRESYQALLENGANPNIVMGGRRVVTHWAASRDDPWWLRLALEHGADPNLVNVGSGRPSEGTPLHFAIGNGSVTETPAAIENVRLLVGYGADINQEDRFGCAPLADAGAQNKFRIVLFLLEQGAAYGRARCSGMSFLEDIRIKCENRDRWFLLKEDRESLDAVREWLEAKGVEIEDMEIDEE